MKTHLENPYSNLSLPNIASMKEDKSKQLISLNLHGPFCNKDKNIHKQSCFPSGLIDSPRGAPRGTPASSGGIRV